MAAANVVPSAVVVPLLFPIAHCNKYVGVYTEHEHCFLLLHVLGMDILILITHDQSKEFRLHKCAITRVQDYTDNILLM